jgi:hypothetical protein
MSPGWLRVRAAPAETRDNPPAEIAAVRGLLTDHIGLHRQEIPGMVVKLLGFKATSPKLKDAIDAAVSRLIEQGQATGRDGKVDPPQKS